MILPNISRREDNRGFTIMEVIIVVALVTLIGAWGLLVSADSLRMHTFYSERDRMVSALQFARAKAVGNVCLGEKCARAQAHGVFVKTKSGYITDIVLFQGESYDPESEINISAPTRISLRHSGVSSIVFEPARGNVWRSGDIVLSDSAGHVSTTTVGPEGEISWTH